MRSRKAANEQVAEVARRRLELLSAELAGISRSLPAEGAPEASPDERPPDPEAAPGAASGGAQPRSAPVEPVADPSAAPVVPGRHAHRSIGVAGRVGGWVHDRLPPTLQGSVGLTSAHLTVVALLVAVAMAAAAWWVLRAEGPGTVVPTASSPPSATSPSPLVDLSPAGVPAGVPEGVPADVPVDGSAPTTAGAQGTVPAGADIVVDVAGKVRRPGIATLPVGPRVADALDSAGGARRNVDLMALNLARVLVDGEQILVGVRAPSGVAAPAASAPVTGSTGAPAPLVNINTAAEAELDTLPGVGPVTAQAILTWRTENGAFSSVDELLEVSGIGDVTLAEMAPFVTI